MLLLLLPELDNANDKVTSLHGSSSSARRRSQFTEALK